ncbi:translation initiation factor eIF-2 beta subunit [Conoideocrella luteorostrata]|uniref:Translation initiation factor eIF-2 beta subunit n=1 Tax=Conoideocrella luteorostrata TaxID=1105319 RepID=A0AAJ0CWM5_9HYPO|nr:translation initiation factor eIF-2 beta subunit [Conoideocrella luteorostrata]
MVTATEEPKDSAQSHTPRTPPLSAALGAFTDASAQAATDDGPPAEDGGLDLTLLKKKKKKKVKTKEATEEDEFARQLKDLEVKDAKEAADATTVDEETGDMDAGTGVWAHDETKNIGYSLLLERFFHQLSQKNPDHTISGAKSFKIPPPQCMREGNRKTVFANIADICKRMKRTEDHLTAYLFAELGTNGSVDGSRRLVIKGRFQQKQIEGMVRKYIIEYVTCKTCKSPDTELSKGENRLYFVTCNNCGSRRSVTAIKTGFSAQVGKRKKMKV